MEPGDVEPSAHVIAAAKSPRTPKGLPSLNRATTPVNIDPAIDRMGWAGVPVGVDVSGASLTVAVPDAIVVLLPMSPIST
jgi:hypothetical protein